MIIKPNAIFLQDQTNKTIIKSFPSKYHQSNSSIQLINCEKGEYVISFIDNFFDSNLELKSEHIPIGSISITKENETINLNSFDDVNEILYQNNDNSQYQHLFEEINKQNEQHQKTLEKIIEIKLKRVKKLLSFVGKEKENEILRDMNRIIQLYHYDSYKLEKCWKALVDKYAPGKYF